ncbi:MAG TPA: RidA family protein [Egicoccus sp.]|nr:RidA family protein [Egicoccus sp.]HSK22864.1 RidA family protein [Egicoccus sp.]
MPALERLEELGLRLPSAPAPAAAYQPWVQLPADAGGLTFTAGQLPVVEGSLPRTGKLGADLTTAEGAELARTAGLNVLAVAAAAFGDLDRVRIVKVTVFVASTPDFTEQHLVANGASELFAAVLGDAGVHARSAVGVPVLPLDSPVEVEAILTAR